MAVSDHVDIDQFMAGLKRRNPGETEFHQAVYEVAMNVYDYIQDKEKYHQWQILRRIAEPDRIIIFRVCWEDDNGNIRVNRGYRVQNNNSIGPYKGGIRFHPSVNLSILKFLAFEQTFKNSLTGLPMGGGKGGSDFNPKGKSDNEVMRFCQAFMSELYRHIGEDTDVPAGDIGVGAREIGYMFGQYKRLKNSFVGVLTGKGMEFGGSPIRTEATGYGTVYFMQDMLAHQKNAIEGKTCLVSGSGNVATYATEKLTQLGGKVVTLSDSTGFIYDKEGIDKDKLAFIVDLKGRRRGRIEEAAKEFGCEFHAGKRPWSVPCDLAFPCATQNEISTKEAHTLIENGCQGVSEGANMPTEQEGIHAFTAAKILFAPSKAANAGGVAVSGLEMSQNSARITWKEAELQQLLRDIMQGIHDQCLQYGKSKDSDYVDYVKGANIAGFTKVADAMIAYGVL
ncbi:NADP-specific glutamate dehydrogenase [Oceanibacterium hippocampi]|uniref:Glutamate dehydrogenase n=1 Tax=Oceanibacterium hippocampi TaxID=745714 RepID=A0A1Y5RB87_9PROT|nr:NADP-specific glutamate dehydrogenase [Oceanibacterium hippocampi]SLN12618.1 NAD(P)-specific glutamate dehydrogenase [Oceanibacterium hippocampi]